MYSCTIQLLQSSVDIVKRCIYSCCSSFVCLCVCVLLQYVVAIGYLPLRLLHFVLSFLLHVISTALRGRGRSFAACFSCCRRFDSTSRSVPSVPPCGRVVCCFDHVFRPPAHLGCHHKTSSRPISIMVRALFQLLCVDPSPTQGYYHKSSSHSISVV